MQSAGEGPANPAAVPWLDRLKLPAFLLVSLAIAAGVGVLLWKRPAPATITIVPPEPTPIPSATPIPSLTPTPGPYMVYVTGAVAHPETVVTLPYGSRVGHALEAAGGALPEADLERVNLAQILNDGDQVHVPTRAADELVARAAPAVMITPTPGTLVVYVTGEVVRPQAIVTLPAGSRVSAALDAAGGPTDNADLSRVNLSQVLNDGDLVYVPPLDGTAATTPTPNHPALVHINYATVTELDALPGIGPELAQAIIEYRTQNGPFAGLDDLDNVPGIGATKIDAIRDLIVFD